MAGPKGRIIGLVKKLDPRRSLTSSRSNDLLFVLLIFLTICVFFWKIILYPNNIIYSANSDTIEQFFPWRYAAHEAMGEGEIPFWNQFNNGGEPLLANMQLGFFYPINIILFWLLPVHAAFGFSFMLHLFIAGVSVYFVGKRVGLKEGASFLSSMVFIFSGYFIGHIYSGHYGQVCAASWIPLIYLLFDITLKKNSWKWGALTGTIVGIQFLAGHIQIVLFSIILLLISYIFHIYSHRKNLKKFKDIAKTIPAPLLGGVVSVSIASVQIIPSFIFTNQSTRSGGISYPLATEYSLPPWNFTTLLAPNVFGTPLKDNYWNLWNYWDLSIYIGIPTIALVALAYKYRQDPYVKFFFVLGIISLIMALGRFTPVYWLFWKIVPGFDILRAPSRFVLLALFSASILAGFGFNSLLGRLDRVEIKRLLRLNRSLAAFTAVVTLILVLLLIFKGPIYGLAEETIVDVIPGEGESTEAISKIGSAFNTAVTDIFVTLFLLLGTICLLTWRMKRRERPRSFGIVMISFILLNLAVYEMPFIDSVDPDEVYKTSPFIVFLQENSQGYRVYDPNCMISDNFQILYNIETIGGYNPLELKHYSELIGSIHNLSQNTNHPILDILGVKYVIVRKPLEGSGFELAFDTKDEGGLYIYENPQVLPRAFLVSNFSVMTYEETLRELSENDFDPLDSVIVTKIPEIKGVIGDEEMNTSNVDIVYTTCNRIDLKVNLTEKSYLVLSKSYYSSWDVHVDGLKSRTDRVFQGLTGVYLNEGCHNVSFNYERYP